MDIRYAVRVFAFKDNKVACIKYKNINKDYFDRINNEIVTEYVSEVYGELQRLMEKPCFDDPKILEPLYEIINKYYKKFMKYRG